MNITKCALDRSAVLISKEQLFIKFVKFLSKFIYTGGQTSQPPFVTGSRFQSERIVSLFFSKFHVIDVLLLVFRNFPLKFQRSLY